MLGERVGWRRWTSCAVGFAGVLFMLQPGGELWRWEAGVLLIAFSPSVVGTIGGALTMGLFGTLSLMANQAVLSDLHGDQRTIALTESNVVATSASITAPLLIGGLAAAGWGWQSAVILTLPCALLLWAVFRSVQFPPSKPPAADHADDHHLPLAFWMLCVVLFLVASVEWCVIYWGADFLASVVGLERAAAASAMTLFFVAMAGGRLLGSRLARRYAGVTLLLAAIVIALGGFLLFWLAAAPLFSLIGLFVAGLGIANFYPLTVAVATGAAPHLIDRATARLAVAGGAALLLAPLAVGAISDVAGMRWGFGIVAPLLLIGFVSVGISSCFLGRQARGEAIVSLPPAAG